MFGPRLLVATCLIASAAHASVLDGDVSAYQSIVGHYRAGDFVEASRQIASWKGRRLLETTAKLREQSEREPSAQDVTAVAAACLLHLEVLRDPGSRSLEDGVHLRIAR